jgi:hypothetical protein
MGLGLRGAKLARLLRIQMLTHGLVFHADRDDPPPSSCRMEAPLRSQFPVTASLLRTPLLALSTWSTSVIFEQYRIV